MKIIEFIGPNGIGKTHLTDLLLKSGDFIKQHDLPFFRKLPNFLFSFVLFLEKTILRVITRKIKTLANMSYTHYFDNLITSLEREKMFSGYLEILFEYTTENNASSFYRRLGLMIRTLTVWDLATKFSSIRPEINKFIVFDEGLAQRAISLASHGVDIDKIKQYLIITPKPDFLICLYASEDEILRRRSLRGSNPGNVAEIKSLLSIVFECEKIYRDAGVKILHLDVTTLNNKVVNEIENFIFKE